MTFYGTKTWTATRLSSFSKGDRKGISNGIAIGAGTGLFQT
jgi:hypothetical protein